MENLEHKRKSGISHRGLRIWGLILLTAGIVGRSIFQKEFLGIGQISGQELLSMMGASSDAMLYATLALILQAVEACAVPVFAFLLMEGFQHASSFKNYVLRIAGLAVVCEIPYNFAMSGKVLDLTTRNPVFGLLIGLVVLYLYRNYGEKTLQHRFIKVVVAVATILWASILKVDSAVCLILIGCVLWIFRKNTLLRNLAGTTAAVVCTLVSPFFLAAPMGFLLVHFYNGKKDEGNRVVKYLTYPVLLIVIGLIAKFAV